MNPLSSSSAEAVISVAGLCCRFGTKSVLEDVSLHVPPGCVFGLVGENGAGKTTLIRHLLGMLRPATGSVRVFHRDPVADPIGVLARVGYLSEHRDLPAWMRIRELLRYTAAFYPDWDPRLAEDLREQFALDPAARVRTLSQGQQAKAALLLALAHRPPLLLLDEPSSGLDPVVRRDILEAIIRAVAEEGRTVLFSSHLLDEIERVADHIAMIRNGRVVLCGRLDDVKQAYRRIILRFPEPLKAPPQIERALVVRGSGCEWTALCRLDPCRVAGAVHEAGARLISDETPSLDEIFVAQAVGKECVMT
jgi:ABC-2 type transport system ATP-binding protein